MGGQYYGDSFHDVDKHIVDYFTYKALRVVLEQLQEMDTSPGKLEYTWLYQFAVENSVRDSNLFIKTLLSTRPDFGERILVTRTHLCEQVSGDPDDCRDARAHCPPRRFAGRAEPPSPCCVSVLRRRV